MRFVKSAAEISTLQGLYARCHLIRVKSLTVFFETDPAALARILPPPLEPAPNHVAVASVGEVGNSNCAGPYEFATLGVRARFGDALGTYGLSAPISTSQALTFGREYYGEPRKLARIVFEQQDDHVWGSAERNEIRFLSMRGRCDQPAPAGRQEVSDFHFKYSLSPDGFGLDSPPLLVQTTTDLTVTTARRGRGEVIFRDSPHDPVIDLPVTQVLDAVYIEGHAYRTGRVIGEADPAAFLPYSFNGMDCAETTAEGTVLHAQASRQSRDGKGEWRKTA